MKHMFPTSVSYLIYKLTTIYYMNKNEKSTGFVSFVNNGMNSGRTKRLIEKATPQVKKLLNAANANEIDLNSIKSDKTLRELSNILETALSEGLKLTLGSI